MARVQQFRADIQGLRAVAIVPVVLYHALGDWVPGGFAGVDVFFVISGFLITRILVREIADGSFSIAGFYARRVRRLLPALFVMLAAALAAGLVLLPPQPLADLGESTAWTAYFAANIHQYRSMGYFVEAAELQPLLHAWSLGVEEQFYIVFPVFLAVMSRYLPRLLKPAIWACAIVSLAWSWHLTRVWPDGAFYLPHSRAYELAIGALLALGAVPRIGSARMLDALSLAGLAMILASFAAVNARTPYPGLAGLLPCLGTAAVIYAGNGRETPAGRWLALAPLQFLGAISYSLYLWHWPVLVFARYAVLGALGPVATVLALAVALGLAVLSYRFVEQPVLRSRAGRRTVLTAGAGAVVLIALCGEAIAGLGGLPQRFGERSLALFAAADGFNPRRKECHYVDGPTDYARSCVFGAPGAAPSVAVWADSFGAELTVPLGEQLAEEGRAVRQLTASACPPSLGYGRWDRPQCAGHNRAVLAGLARDPAIETVVLFAHYNGYGADRDKVLAGMGEAVRALHAAGKRIVLVDPLPVPGFDVPKALGMIAWRGGDPAAWAPPRTDADSQAAERFLDRLAAEVGAARILPASALCSPAGCRAVGPDGAVLYFDDRHLSLAGARLVLARQPLPARPLDD